MWEARPALEVVYDPLDAEVDIVAVHGLGANVDWTWIWKDSKVRSLQVQWLSDADMLPDVIPKARVILYNYDSRWHADAPRITLQICGDRFIQALHDFRRNLRERPIVFLGHSLGSIVIQHGLLIADTKDDFRYLTAATSGLVTLGSPLRGIRKNVQPSFLIKLLQFRGSWGGIIDELKYENDTLLEKLERFIRLSKARNFDIFCFFELYETKFGKKFFLGGKFGVPLRAMIVPETSACLSGFDRCGLQADHFRINKFSGPNDASFMRVSAQLLQICTKALNNKHESTSNLSPQQAQSIAPSLVEPQNIAEAEKCLKTLFLSNPMDDLSTMKRMKGSRAEGTCEWILQTPELSLWLSQSQSESGAAASNFLWLRGDPGVGKSTMAMFLAEHLMHPSLFPGRYSTAFFLCSSTFDTRNNTTAILRGLLWQFLSKNRQMIPRHVSPLYKTQGSSIFASFDTLWSIFIGVMSDSDFGTKYLIIDGLDECKSEGVFALLKLLKRAFGPQGVLRDSPSCRLLILSRPAPDIQRAFRSSRVVNLSTASELIKDVASFIEEKVSDLEISIPYPSAVAQDVAQTLKRKAGGTFLWAGIACAELERCDAKDALRCLETLPSSLNDLYQGILSSVCGHNAKNRDKIRQLLGFAITSMYPLSLLELSAACKLHTEHSAQVRGAFMLEEIESCRRLLVVDNGRVHVLHESVKDFLQSEASGNFINEQEAHAQLARRCIEVIYWSSVDVEPSTARRLLWSGAIEWSRFEHGFGQLQQASEDVALGDLALLGYAMFRWPAHARSAYHSLTLSGLTLLFFDSRSILWKAWSAVFLVHLMQPSLMTGHSDGYAGRSWLSWTALDAAALTDIPLIANFALQQQKLDVEGRHLMYAAVEKHWEMFNALVSNLSKPVSLSEDSIEDFVCYRYGWPRALEVLQVLFTHPKITSPFTPSLLVSAARNNLKILNLLLKLRPNDLTFDESSMQRWTERWLHTHHHIEASKLLAEHRIPGFIDSDLLMEYLVSTENRRWPVRSVLEVIRIICRFRSHKRPFTLKTWLKAAEKDIIGPEILRLLLERGGLDLASDQEDVILAASRNLDSGADILKVMFERAAITLSPAVADKILSEALNGGGVEQVKEILKYFSFDESKLHEEKMLLSACSNAQRFIGFVFSYTQIPTSKVTEGVLLAAARNEGFGRQIFEVFLDTHKSIVPLSETVVTEAAMNGNGLLDLLLDRQAFNKSMMTQTLYDRIERSGVHDRSGNLSKCLLQRRDPALPLPDIAVVARHLTKSDVHDLLAWRGGHIITKEVVLAAMTGYGALASKEDILPLVHMAKPSMVMIDTETLECARLSFPSLGFHVPSLAIKRVREIRGGHLLAEEEEAVRIWWPRHAQGDRERVQQELLEARRKYHNLEAEEEKASALYHFAGSTGDVSSSRQRRASCCLPTSQQRDQAEAAVKRRNTMTI